mmetsp:Transcript_4282/g.17375  ORF Transcript_4282/g.17375 Transcript_4282/m.17375 type:complete len:284 (-) Transcript_4282:222-1073(-)
MILVNKYLASRWTVEARVSLLLAQNAVATVAVVACRALGLSRCRAPLDRNTALAWFPVNCCFVAMLLTSFAAMRYLSVPMITVFKQLANLLTCVGEFYLFGKTTTPGVVVAFVVMTAGAVMAAKHDLAFSGAGYAWQLANCAATSAYVLYLKHATATVQLTRFGMLFYNNVLSLPLLAAVALANDEVNTLRRSRRAGVLDGDILVVIALTGLLSVVLSIASIWCVSATSATTYSVVGALNKIPASVLGFLLFDAPISRNALVYIAVSLCGGFIYSYEKLRVHH